MRLLSATILSLSFCLLAAGGKAPQDDAAKKFAALEKKYLQIYLTFPTIQP